MEEVLGYISDTTDTNYALLAWGREVLGHIKMGGRRLFLCRGDLANGGREQGWGCYRGAGPAVRQIFNGL